MGTLIIALAYVFLTAIDVFLVYKLVDTHTTLQILKQKVDRIEAMQRIGELRIMDSELKRKTR